MREIEEDLNNWRNIPCLWIGKINIVKMSILPKLIQRFNAITMQIPAKKIIDIDNIILKFIQKGKGT